MEGESLQITKLLPAPVERVFEAWTDPDLLSRWFAPGPMTAEATADVRAGGSFRIVMTDPQGAAHTAVGVYREVEPHTRLAFSWSWEGSGGPETQVVVELRPQGHKTELVLTHEGFPTTEVRDQHVHGWSGSTAKLEEMLAAA